MFLTDLRLLPRFVTQRCQYFRETAVLAARFAPVSMPLNGRSYVCPELRLSRDSHLMICLNLGMKVAKKARDPRGIAGHSGDKFVRLRAEH